MKFKIKSSRVMPKKVKYAVVASMAVSAFMIAGVAIPSDIFMPSIAAILAGAGTFALA